MKVCLYSPYLHILGGGEKYLLSIAQTLSDKNEVVILGDEKLKKNIKSVFNLDLSKITFLPAQKIEKANFWEKINFTRNFELFFYMTDGSLFFSGSAKNFLIIQSPAHLPSSTIINSVKFRNWKIICYSDFMRKIIREKLGKEALVVSPCINLMDISQVKRNKDNLILTVGRFFKEPHNKRHDILIDVFKKGYSKYFSGWKLVVAGGLTQGDGDKIIENLKQKSVGVPVEILVNPDFKTLAGLYQKAKIYWHAAGYGSDIKRHPEQAEHFGITTLEAMTSGAVPVVYKAGGQQDIITEFKNGLFWQTKDDLINKTSRIINDNKLYKKLSTGAVKRAGDFSPSKFYENLEKIIS